VDRQDALVMLQQFVLELSSAGIESKAEYRNWAKDNEGILCDLFDYEPEDGMPRMGSLVTPHFHPELPLVGLNYSPLAHNVLYRFSQGWTMQLRMCRGIVFDRYADLVALCLLKFFNAGENAFTKKLPARPHEVLDKLDGHYGQIFCYEGEFYVKTRGSFTHRTSEIANEMLQEAVERKKWKKLGIGHVSLGTEVIHPETHVICDYGERRNLRLIAAFDNRTLEDFKHDKLLEYGKRLGLPVVKRWIFETSKDVLAAVRDPNVRNREGFVVRYADGERVKFKYHAYLGEMVAAKLSYSYLMLRWMDGRVDAVIRKLPEEVIPEAEMMLENLKKARRMRRDIKLKRKYLYELVPPEKSTPYYRTVCRNFLRYKK